MAFQRSYSKVWWGSDNQLPSLDGNAGNSYSYQSYHLTHESYQQQQLHQQQRQQYQFNRNGNGYHSLEFNNFKSYAGNLSCIQEVEDENNISKMSWEKRDSPGSLRSQDSGFSDNDESSQRGISGENASPSSKSTRSSQSSSSPTGANSIATPPTVIRRVGKSAFYSPLVSVSRRISFSRSPKKSNNEADVDDENETEEITEDEDIMSKIDSMQLVNNNEENINDSIVGNQLQDNVSGLSDEKCVVRRRKRVTRKATKPLTPTKRRTYLNNNYNTENDSDDNDALKNNNSTNDNLLDTLNDSVPEYNNETVYLGTAPPPYNNETIILGSGEMIAGGDYVDDANNNTLQIGETLLSPLRTRQQSKFAANTSTPKQYQCSIDDDVNGSLIVSDIDGNPLLNGHQPALQDWLHGLKNSYESEVMSTLQTKSITQEALNNLTITSNTVAKLIRQLQQRAIYLQSDFDRIERLLINTECMRLHEALTAAEQLVKNVYEFTKVLERRAVFFSQCRLERRKYDDNLEQINIILKDTHYSLQRQHYINVESLCDDIQVLKRCLLITIRLVFEKMAGLIVNSIEEGRSDLMLRANINMVVTLMNIEYEGFASLTDAFVQNEVVRTLLLVCMENNSSSVRALALRALASVCCSPEAIGQLGSSGGIEILRDILNVSSTCGRIERREAVSLLTQLTAIWHGPEHRVEGLKDCIETIVEGLSEFIGKTECSQTLLLCTAALNNLSRIEVTSHYSIMSNEAIHKTIDVIIKQPKYVSIFLYEQMAAMLHNMSLNKKCHSHLANGIIINFITSTYEEEFYKTYPSRAENEAQHRTVKAILHTLTQLVQHSSMGMELLKQYRIPAFFAINSNGSTQSDHGRTIIRRDGDEGDTMASTTAAATVTATAASLKLNLSKPESFV